MRSLLRAAGPALLLGLLPVLALAAEPAAHCPPSPSGDPLRLPALQGAVASGAETVIVAFGSSSTAGSGASDPAHTYPARLQTELERLLPGNHIAVLNRGIGGQDAPEELARLESDVIAVRPRLVIWQVGANAALRHADPGAFEARVAQGVQRLRQAGIDVILMDNQRSPRILAQPAHDAPDRALAEVAAREHVNLFSRSALMDAWERHGAAYHEFLSPDGMHHNDLGYACVSRALAGRIAAAASPAIVSVSAGR